VIDKGSGRFAAVPEVPGDATKTERPEYRKQRYWEILDAWKASEAALDVVEKARQDAEIARKKADQDAEIARLKDQQDAEIARLKADQDAQIADKKNQQDAQIARLKAEQDGDVDLQKAQQLADVALEKAEIDADLTSRVAIQTAMIDLVKGSVDRSKAAATFVQAAAVAVSTLYTGALAFVAVGAGHTVPARGLIPVVFLGLAIAMAAGYMAFVSREAATVVSGQLAPSRRQQQMQRVADFTEWVNGSVLQRSAFLRAAVVSLGVGAVFLPIGIVNSAGINELSWHWATVAGAIVAVTYWSDSLTELAKAIVNWSRAGGRPHRLRQLFLVLVVAGGVALLLAFLLVRFLPEAD
jgi:hypothetical protein